MKTSSMFSPNENPPAITFDAKPGHIREKSYPPLITRLVDMLTCKKRSSLLRDLSGMHMPGIKTTFVKPSKHG
ncbi:hypothetical protein TNCV_557001 [Trichonephila clavipes]|uniref:Uncharacterized protein n=1 Tax=Trichonephila clavipes TaxID=2585209 RepID=A0A8X6RN14_TRICX|nr:hypothetical protein TNCV_557001 [Trichonephila clavipes]